MFRPQIQKTKVLFFIAVFNLSMVYFAINSKVKVKQVGYTDKVIATRIMQDCIDSIKNKINYTIDSSDIYQTGLLGIQTSIITTKEDIESNTKKSKIACTHPNFAASIVEMFYELGIKKDDNIAVSMTGSFPGANIALMSACKAMHINPVIISSVGSSAWGANRKEYSWPIIESSLYNMKLFDFKSIAYSIGGANDLGDNLSYDGNVLISNMIFKNLDKNQEFVNEETLIENINRKISLYGDIANYSLYVNIGGGSASLGYGVEKDTLKVGIVSPLDIEYMNLDNLKNSIAYKFLSSNIPMINIKNIHRLGAQYNLYPPSKNIYLNEGPLFIKYNNYNIIVIIIGLVSSLLLITSIGIYSHLQIKKRMEAHEPESII